VFSFGILAQPGVSEVTWGKPLRQKLKAVVVLVAAAACDNGPVFKALIYVYVL